MASGLGRRMAHTCALRCAAATCCNPVLTLMWIAVSGSGIPETGLPGLLFFSVVLTKWARLCFVSQFPTPGSDCNTHACTLALLTAPACDIHANAHPLRQAVHASIACRCFVASMDFMGINMRSAINIYVVCFSHFLFPLRVLRMHIFELVRCIRDMFFAYASVECWSNAAQQLM